MVGAAELFLCETLVNNKWTIVVFGDSHLRRKLVVRFGARPLSNISDKDLAEVYAQCRLAVCPQKWETFGYVAAEAIGCGTTPLAFNCMGLAEVVNITGNGLLANNETEFLGLLSEGSSESRHETAQSSYPFSSKNSAEMWHAFLQKTN